VIPDEAESDHPGLTQKGLGPSYVASIVDAIGNSKNNPCGTDYWGYQTPPPEKSEPTAIFIVWDDWGGFYDHVTPWAYYTGDSGGQYGWECTTQDGAPNGWGCAYTSGFRVPLLVVSEYTGPGYISGKCGVTGYPNCGQDAKAPPYVHDFGSILRFTELNFGMDYINEPYYADYNAPDNTNPNTSVPLSDFFQQGPNPFTKIPPLAGQDQSFFLNYYNNPAYGNPKPQGPDGTDEQ
jgi:Phosphoesterase family